MNIQGLSRQGKQTGRFIHFTCDGWSAFGIVCQGFSPSWFGLQIGVFLVPFGHEFSGVEYGAQEEKN
jgi:hypothetical protein